MLARIRWSEVGRSWLARICPACALSRKSVLKYSCFCPTLHIKRSRSRLTGTDSARAHCDWQAAAAGRRPRSRSESESLSVPGPDSGWHCPTGTVVAHCLWLTAAEGPPPGRGRRLRVGRNVVTGDKFKNRLVGTPTVTRGDSSSPTRLATRKLHRSKVLRSRKSWNVEVSCCPRVLYSGTLELEYSSIPAFHLVQW